ncbi:hypothetical protein TWF730_009158 [Orbilia blumenaviensis]|uniref:Mid2 domain-containing protein n=1 Tax=Orbilia blumenaviensis TaxID=1796055 RepID=A0AAV9UYY2_9PEZI
MRLGAPPRAFPLFLLLSTVFSYTTAQGTGRFFIQPEGLDESATGPDRFDSSIQWYIGDEVTVRWEAEFESVTLRLWQGVFEGKYWYNDLLRNDPNTLSYTWTVGPVLSQAQTLNLHFQLLDSSDTERNFNSKDFRIYNRTDTLTETLLTTTRERTVTREVTVTQSADVESTSSSPSSTPTDIDTQTTPESDGTSSVSSSETEATTSTSAGTNTAGAATTSDSVPPPTSTNTSSDNTAMKVGLGVGLGVGLPLLALVGAGLYFLGKKSGGRGEQPLPNMPSAPPVTSTGAETGWHPGYTVGGIENVSSQAGGAVGVSNGRG